MLKKIHYLTIRIVFIKLKLLSISLFLFPSNSKLPVTSLGIKIWIYHHPKQSAVRLPTVS